MKKYYAIMRNGATILTTVKMDAAASHEEAVAQRNKWAAYYDQDRISIIEIDRRAQAEQKSIHGVTEARGWR